MKPRRLIIHISFLPRTITHLPKAPFLAPCNGSSATACSATTHFFWHIQNSFLIKHDTKEKLSNASWNQWGEEPDDKNARSYSSARCYGLDMGAMG